MDIVLHDVLTYTLLYEGYKLEIILQELVGNTITLLFAKSVSPSVGDVKHDTYRVCMLTQ